MTERGHDCRRKDAQTSVTTLGFDRYSLGWWSGANGCQRVKFCVPLTPTQSWRLF